MEFKDAFNYGLPTVLLFALIVGLWKMILWAKTAVVEPVVTSHLSLIKALQEELEAMVQASGRMAESSKRREDKMNEVAKVAADVAVKQEEALAGIEQTTDNQTFVIKQALEMQTDTLRKALEDQTRIIKETLEAHIGTGSSNTQVIRPSNPPSSSSKKS